MKEHNRKCKADLAALNKRLKIVMGDIAVMTMILDCLSCNTVENIRKVTVDQEGVRK